MGQNKLERFAAIKEFPNVLEYPENMAGKWADHFKNNQPITLELACGKGEYAVGLGAMHPNRNFIGIDVKGNRIYVGAKKALAQNLHNVAFMRTQIDRIQQYFTPGEVQEIWLTFPDPQVRTGKLRKRLTHPGFLRKYLAFLQPGGVINLKTDSPLLYNFTKTVIEIYGCTIITDYNDVYQQATEPELLQIKTHYEGLDIAQSGRIHYLAFSLPATLPGEKDAHLKTTIFENELNGGA